MSKKLSQKWVTFVFGSTYLHQTFTECVSNQYTYFNIFICQMFLQVMERSLIWLRFFWNFHTLLTTICVWIAVFPPKFRRLYVKLMYTIWYVDIPDMTTGYGRFFEFRFLWIFIYYYMFETLYLHQTFTSCVLRQNCKDEK